MRKALLILIPAMVAASPLTGWSYPFRPTEIPNGTLNSCNNCHIIDGGPRNLFGRQVQFYFLTEIGPNGHVQWGPLLASYDADGDGLTNGWELQDPWGLWRPGQPAPGVVSQVRLPGDSTSHTLSMLTVHFQGMTPHLGEELRLRVVDKTTGRETARIAVPSISQANFDVVLDAALHDSGYYWIDFFVDFNGNNRYDPPPVDHAWRLLLVNPTGAEEMTFIHNTDFTDVAWVYELEMNFSGMLPHLNQALEVRIVDQETSFEAGRARVDVLDAANFTLRIPGLRDNRNYDVDFYADLNVNGWYDAPPADHAWRETITNAQGDQVINFVHNTDFTDVQWKHLFTLHLHEMTPHLNDYFALRIVDNGANQELGRIELDSVRTAEFSLSAPGLAVDLPGDTMAFRADFWADFNGNGQYDPPPADHAWRLNFADTTGDVVLNFTHNTDFTDIQWPAVGVPPLDPSRPVTHLLARVWPNPFNPAARIIYDLPEPAFVSLKVYNLKGEVVATLFEGRRTRGRYEAVWEPGTLASGLYLYRLTAGEGVINGKLVLLK